MHNTTI